MESVYNETSNAKNQAHPRKLLHLITNALHIPKSSTGGNFPKSATSSTAASVAGSSSSSSSYHHDHMHRRPPLDKPSERSMEERIVRALSHPLLLLHRADSVFFILGATRNVYTVTLSPTPTCTCPDHTTPCKHILFVYLRVLGMSRDDACIRRKTLRPCQLSRVLKMPTLPNAVAGASLRESFHRQYVERKQGSFAKVVKIEEKGITCPVCLEEMKKEKKAVACGTCRNPIHEECLVKWKRSRGTAAVCCVICRAPWKDRTSNKYLNLSAYVSEDDFEDATAIATAIAIANANDASNVRSTARYRNHE